MGLKLMGDYVMMKEKGKIGGLPRNLIIGRNALSNNMITLPLSIRNEKHLPINGTQTLRESVADNGGTRKAFGTWKRSEQQGYNVTLPGLEQYTPEQMFFVAMASNFCSKTNPKGDLESNEIGAHAPDHARVNGVLQNMKEFRQVFQCTVGKRMAPIRQCEVW
jgi:endothelin-converting enzyme